MPISSPAVATPAQTVLRPLRNAARQGHPIISKFLRDRGPHLAAMVAYYALLSLVPFMFLTLSLLGFVGHVSASSYLIRELGHILPGQSTARPPEAGAAACSTNAGTLGVIGLFGIVWASLGFYSALESALNIVFRVQNRAFLHQKWVTFVLVMVSLVVLFASLLATIAATGWVDRHVPHLIHLNIAAYLATMAASSIGSFLFLMAVYRYLTNVELHRGDVWPGAVVGTVLFQMLVPGAAALPALLGPAARAAGVRRPRHPARVALPDGEHHRAGRRDQLVSLVAAPAGRRRRSWRAAWPENWCLALIHREHWGLTPLLQEREERAGRAGAVGDRVLLARRPSRPPCASRRRGRTPGRSRTRRAARRVGERAGQLAAGRHLGPVRARSRPARRRSARGDRPRPRARRSACAGSAASVASSPA